MVALAGFTIERDIDRGPMDRLRIARDPEGRRFALRTFRPSDEVHRNLEDVGALCGLVRHPNLRHGFAHGVDPTHGPYVLREWVEGSSLEARGVLSGRAARQVLAAVAEALSVVHGFGLAHGRVDARRVVLEGDRVDRARLVDLGVALISGDGERTTGLDLTRPDAGLDFTRDLEDLRGLGVQITRDPTVHALLEQSEDLLTLSRALARPPAPRARGHSLLVEDLEVPATGQYELEDDTLPPAEPRGPRADPLADLRKQAFDQRYAVREEIARGGMGAIIAAEDRRLGRDLAIKVMHAPERAPPGLLLRFVDEAQVQGRLEHPNICPVHELGLDDEGQPYFAMKRVRGQSLSEFLRAEPRPPLSRSLEIFLRVCDAMAFAHARGVVHRDLKPDNVMVGEFGEVLVMDWGIAKVMGQAERPLPPSLRADRPELLTSAGQAMGTPHYMPPEQAEGALDIDVRADVYALGGVLYTILTGERPVSGASLPALLVAVMRGQIPPPSERAVDRDVPKDLEAACMRALATDRAARYPNVRALADDVRAYLDGRTLRAAAYSPAERLAKWYGRNRLFARMALAVLTTAAVGGALYLSERARAQTERRIAAVRRLGEGQASLQARDWVTAHEAFSDAEARLAELDAPTMRAAFGRWTASEHLLPRVLPPTRTGTISDLVLLDEQRYVTAAGRWAHVRDVATGAVQHRLTTGGPIIEGLAAAPSGRRLVAKVKGDGFVVWDARTGERLRGVPARHVDDYALLDDARLAYVAKHALRVVRLSDRHVIAGPEYVRGDALEASPDGRFLLVSSPASTAVHRSRDLRRVGEYTWRQATSPVAISADGAHLLAGSASGDVQVDGFDVLPRSPFFPRDSVIARHHRGRIVHIEAPRDGDRFLSQDATGKVVLWRFDDALEPVAMTRARPGALARISPRGDFVLIAQDGQVTLHSSSATLTHRRPEEEIDLGSGPAQWSLDGRALAMPTESGVLLLWADRLEPFARYERGLVPFRTQDVTDTRRSTDTRVVDPTGQFELRVNREQAVLGPLSTAQTPTPRPGFEPDVLGLSPGGRYAVFDAPKVGTTTCLDIQTGQTKGLEGTHLRPFPRFSSDGARVLLTGASDHDERPYGFVVWDLPSDVATAIGTHRTPVVHATFSEDDRLVFAIDGDGTVVEVDLESRSQRTLLQVATSPRQLSVSADGQWLAIGADDGQVHVVHRPSGAHLGSLTVSTGFHQQLAFHPRRPLLLVQTSAYQPHIFDLGALTPGDELEPGFGLQLLQSGLSELACPRIDTSSASDPLRVLPCAMLRSDPVLAHRLVDRAEASEHVSSTIAEVLRAGLPPSKPGVDLQGRTPLSRAVARGDLERVRALLAAGADPTAELSNGLPLTARAAFSGHLEVFEALVAAGAPLDLPLTFKVASLRPDPAMVEALLQAYPNADASLGAMTAVLGANPDTQASLLAGVKLGQDTLDFMLATVVGGKGVTSSLEALLQAGASAEGQGARSPYGQRPLLRATTLENHLHVQRLLRAGADPNVADMFGTTPLDAAISTKDRDLVELLLAHGADPNAPVGRGRTPLIAALHEGAFTLIGPLLRAGADADRPDTLGRRPAFAAVDADGRAALNALLEAGADPSHTDARGRTLLHRAVDDRKLWLLELALRFGAKDLEDPDDHRAIDEARARGYVELVRALEDPAYE